MGSGPGDRQALDRRRRGELNDQHWAHSRLACVAGLRTLAAAADGPPGGHGAEGAFLLCGFWMAQVAQARGEHAEAGHWLERNRAACDPAGLYTEEYDVHQRQLPGNLPQAFVHAGLLETAVRLSSPS